MVDFGFKKIFKESGNQRLIIRPLNAVFGLDIASVTIEESELLGLTEEERRASFDIHCTASDGSEFIIEVQLAEQQFFAERAIYYSALTIAHQGERGQWDFSLHPVFFLGLMNFDLRHLEPQKADPGKFIHHFTLREDESGEQMSRALRFAFMEVQRFDKPKEECKCFEEKFLYIMKNLPTFVEKPELWDDPYFEEMIQEAEFASMTLEEKRRYALAMKQRRDYENTIDFARQQGLNAGREEGRAEGRAEGRLQQAKQTAQTLKEAGVDITLIIKSTGLNGEDIAAL